MSIKLAVALEENVIVRHIRERLDSSKSYSCSPAAGCRANRSTVLRSIRTVHRFAAKKEAIDSYPARES